MVQHTSTFPMTMILGIQGYNKKVPLEILNYSAEIDATKMGPIWIHVCNSNSHYRIIVNSMYHNFVLVKITFLYRFECICDLKRNLKM